MAGSAASQGAVCNADVTMLSQLNVVKQLCILYNDGVKEQIFSPILLKR
jgi:hypothetical protein